VQVSLRLHWVWLMGRRSGLPPPGVALSLRRSGRYRPGAKNRRNAATSRSIPLHPSGRRLRLPFSSAAAEAA